MSKGSADKSSNTRPAGKRLGTLGALLPYLSRYRLQILVAGIFLALAAASTLSLPAAVRHLVDTGLNSATDLPLDLRLAQLRHEFFLLFLVAVAMAVFTAARFFTVSWIGERVTADLRQAVYQHVLRQSPQFFETLKTGEVLSRLTTDTTVIQNAIGSSISMGLRSAVMAIGAMGMLLTTSPRLMLTVLGIIVLVVAPSLWIGRRVRQLSRATQDRIADTSGLAGEVLNAVGVVQSFTQEERESERYGLANQSAFRTAVRRIRTRAAFTAFIILGVFSALLYGLYGGVAAVFAGTTTAGTLSQTVLYMMLVASSVAVLAEVWGDLLRAAGATERITELLAQESAIRDAVNAETLQPGRCAQGLDIQMKHVVFAYPARPHTPILAGFDLHVRAGTTVALVGPSGAGKSTVFQLLQRNYDAQSGSIQVSDWLLTNLKLNSLRAHIAVVPQEPVIFSGSIRDNIGYADVNATPDQIVAAARAAHVDEFVRALPDGYDTAVGERGVRLSGGQRQRIAIARAILKNAPLLLLDEATSSLDAESERIVQQALQAAMQGRTTIVIAHRLATVQRADRIYVMEHGQIVEQGRHDELIAQQGLYARLAALQFTA